MSSDDVHFVEDLEERENATSLLPPTLIEGEDGGDIITQSCAETGCGGFPGFGDLL